VRLLDDAVEAILVNDESKRRYLSLAEKVDRAYRAILPDRAANEFGPVHTLLVVIAEKILSLAPEADLTEVIGEVEHLLDESVIAEEYVIKERQGGARIVDLSKIDLEALKAGFAESQKRAEAERLRGRINNKLRQLVHLNRTRMNYLEEFQRMIDEYNAWSPNIESWFSQLVAFAQSLQEEEKRHLAQGLTEEELAVFDLLTRPEIYLTRKEEQQVKKVAQELLETLKREKLVLDWRKKQQARAAVRLAIEKILDQLPQKYTPDLYRQKCEMVYQHIYDSYYGQTRSVYAYAA
jgi:type I restriction enzyme R subunit